ncbi:hypothetical protein AGRA3207_007061 [Actinomadura graeca]|uniref:Uncharacterized protein n=1 Tax=Actinomadura graeca TaxID=2750812 RepID=A0ABX8R3D7_9ACTN|nr:hypothetical protein [Actinomadura graeca]QXJ25550.1 hypothetical protein AGRA3207_007061 [Actinomadura graeca]
MREETAPHDEVLARFTGARLYEHGEDGTAYLAERGGVPYLLVRPEPASPDMTVIAFDDELERASHLAGRASHLAGRAVPPPRPPSHALARAVPPPD